MKIMMIIALLVAIAGVALGDSILAVLGVVSLACAAVDVLACRYPVCQSG